MCNRNDEEVVASYSVDNPKRKATHQKESVPSIAKRKSLGIFSNSTQRSMNFRVKVVRRLKTTLGIPA